MQIEEREAKIFPPSKNFEPKKFYSSASQFIACLTALRQPL